MKNNTIIGNNNNLIGKVGNNSPITINQTSPIDTIDNDDKKTILFLASMPTGEGKLQLEKEFTKIHFNLQDESHLYELKAEWAVKPSDLHEVIFKHQPYIIHFSGHGKDKNDDNDGGLLFEDKHGQAKLVPPTAITNMFKLLKEKVPIEIVVLNACYSKEQAKGISKHIPYVIGMNSSVEDETSISFSTGFYNDILKEDVEYAFNLAVNMIQLEGLEDDDVPVLLKQ